VGTRDSALDSMAWPPAQDGCGPGPHVEPAGITGVPCGSRPGIAPGSSTAAVSPSAQGNRILCNPAS
jgi:hypothetical protein